MTISFTVKSNTNSKGKSITFVSKFVRENGAESQNCKIRRHINKR